MLQGDGLPLGRRGRKLWAAGGYHEWFGTALVDDPERQLDLSHGFTPRSPCLGDRVDVVSSLRTARRRTSRVVPPALVSLNT